MFLILTLLALWTATAAINSLTQGYYILKRTNLKASSFDEVNNAHLQMIRFLFVINTLLLFSISFFGVPIYWWASIILFSVLMLLGISSGIRKVKLDIYNQKINWSIQIDDYYSIGFTIFSIITFIIAFFIKD